MLKQILICAFLGMYVTTFAQNEGDVRRYSSQNVFGTARYTGMGGAMGALGGDMSALHINPAGIGLYRFGEISFTPAIEINDLDLALNGDFGSASLSKLVINNAGFVLSNEVQHPYWRSINFGVTFNRINTFNDELFIETTNDVSQSLIQDFVLEANGRIPDNLSPFGALLAWEAFVIDTISATEYTGRANTGEVQQRQTAERSGRQTETALSFGANYNDILYLGASIGIQSVLYRLDVRTLETPLDVVNTDLANYDFIESLEIEGLGLNAKFGAIVRAGRFLRIGASIHTPTTFSFTDAFRNQLNSRLRAVGDFPAESIETDSGQGLFDYRVRTPWRYMLSLASVIGKKGILSVQYEYANLANGELRNSNFATNGADFSFANEVVRTEFTGQHTFRAGGEYRFAESFYFRGGFVYQTNPIPANEAFSRNLDRVQYSGGIGLRKKTFNIDLAYSLATVDEAYKANNSGNVGVITSTFNTIALTLGLRL
jgi:hypothetical protein